MSKPQLYNIDTFDANNECVVSFLWNGNQSFGNICTIKENDTKKIIYQETKTTMQLKHIVPANTFTNGKSYEATIITFDIDGNESEESDAVLFHCFTTPSFSFTNIEQDQLIKNASYEITMDYSQIENELLQSWEITLYDTSRSKIQTSGVRYDEKISYTLTNLEDKKNYYLKATCMTVNGLEVSTDYLFFQVRYKYPSVYSLLTLENVKNDGYIKLRSNIRAVEAHSDKNVEYINNEYADLTDNSIYIDDDFSFDDDFIINLLGYDFSPNDLIMQLSDGQNVIKMYYRHGTYDINDNIKKAFIELVVPIGFTYYVTFSNYIDIPKDTDMLNIWIKKKNGLYGVYIDNKGGE